MRGRRGFGWCFNPDVWAGILWNPHLKGEMWGTLFVPTNGRADTKSNTVRSTARPALGRLCLRMGFGGFCGGVGEVVWCG